MEMTAKKQKEMAENLVKLVARKKHFIQKTIFWVLTFDVQSNLDLVTNLVIPKTVTKSRVVTELMVHAHGVSNISKYN